MKIYHRFAEALNRFCFGMLLVFAMCHVQEGDKVSIVIDSILLGLLAAAGWDKES